MDLPALSVFVCSKVLSIAATFSYNRILIFFSSKTTNFALVQPRNDANRARHLRDVVHDAAALKTKSKNDRDSKAEEPVFIDALIRNVLTTFRRTVVLTNRLLGRSRTLFESAPKRKRRRARVFLSVQGLTLFYTAKRIAQGENVRILSKYFYLFPALHVAASAVGSAFFSPLSLGRSSILTKFFPLKSLFCHYYYSAPTRAAQKGSLVRTTALRKPPLLR